MKTWRQVPGQSYVFQNKKTGEEDKGILPAAYGESNDFAFWSVKGNRKNGGAWCSARFHRLNSRQRRKGGGPQGLLGRMSYLLEWGIRKRSGYKTLLSTPEKMLIQWKVQEGKCIACAESLEILDAHYDHNHETGEGRGFIHSHCNVAEGFLAKMSNTGFKNYIRFISKIRLDKRVGI